MKIPRKKLLNLLRKYSQEKDFSKALINNEMSLLSSQESKKYLKKYNHFLDTLNEVSQIFKNLKGWTVIKIKKIPKPHSDVDILIKPVKFKEFKKILEKKGYILKGKQYRKDFGFVKEKKEVIVELHCGLSYSGIDYVDTERVLKRSRKQGLKGIKFPYVSSEDDFLIFAAHAIFQNDPTQDYKGKSTLNLSDLYQLYIDSKTDPFDWNYVLETSQKYNWTEGVYYTLQIVKKFFSTRTLEKGKKIFSNKINKKIKKKIDLEIKKEIKLPYILNHKILFDICMNKAKKDKSIKERLTYLKWFIYNKEAVLLKKRFLK